MWRRFNRLAAGVLSTAVGVTLLTSSTGYVKAAAPGDPYSRPGRLVMLPDHRKLNLRCSGRGAPTVILESGFGAGSSAWTAVQPRIAQATRVCSYDRAGYGFSDPGPLPRDGQAIARDLDRGLAAAGISGPFVVVGHSAGGLYARLFAARRRRDVVGLVFVDSSVEHQTQRLVALFGARAGDLDGPRRGPARCLEATLKPKAPENAEALSSCAPESLDPRARRLALQPDAWRAQLSELDTLFNQTSDEVDRTHGLLKDIPGVVLTAAEADNQPASSPQQQAWQGFHQALARSLLKGQHRLVRSSHLMMIDRPEVVADAAIQLVLSARRQ